ncbi:MAG: hypothetical protein ACTHJ4_07100 [Candidatus Nucleicultricaceae bacterium]
MKLDSKIQNLIRTHRSAVLNILLTGLFILPCWYFYALQEGYQKHLLQITDDLKKIQDIRSDQKAYQEVFHVISSEQAQKVFLNTKRATFPKIFSQLAESAHLDHLTYTIQKTVHMDGLLDKTTQKTDVTLLCESRDDRSIFRFIDAIKNQFPGFVLIETIRIEKYKLTSSEQPGIRGKITLFVITKQEAED